MREREGRERERRRAKYCLPHLPTSTVQSELIPSANASCKNCLTPNISCTHLDRKLQRVPDGVQYHGQPTASSVYNLNCKIPVLSHSIPTLSSSQIALWYRMPLPRIKTASLDAPASQSRNPSPHFGEWMEESEWNQYSGPPQLFSSSKQNHALLSKLSPFNLFPFLATSV